MKYSQPWWHLNYVLYLLCSNTPKQVCSHWNMCDIYDWYLSNLSPSFILFPPSSSSSSSSTRPSVPDNSLPPSARRGLCATSAPTAHPCVSGHTIRTSSGDLWRISSRTRWRIFRSRTSGWHKQHRLWKAAQIQTRHVRCCAYSTSYREENVSELNALSSYWCSDCILQGEAFTQITLITKQSRVWQGY